MLWYNVKYRLYCHIDSMVSCVYTEDCIYSSLALMYHAAYDRGSGGPLPPLAPAEELEVRAHIMRLLPGGRSTHVVTTRSVSMWSNVIFFHFYTHKIWIQGLQFSYVSFFSWELRAFKKGGTVLVFKQQSNILISFCLDFPYSKEVPTAPIRCRAHGPPAACGHPAGEMLWGESSRISISLLQKPM